MKYRSIHWTILSILLFFLAPIYSFAQETPPCGNIIDYYDGEEYLTPITDCDNPFGITAPNSDITVSFGETVLSENEEYQFINEVQAIKINNSIAFDVYGELYRNRGEDYIFEQLFFSGNEHTFTEPGTYTMVIYEEEEPIMSSNSFIDKLRQFLIPTALAYHGPTYVVTFEVTEPEEQAGASSILFLPGIQASRLYKSGFLGTEDQLWEPNTDNDVEQLEMDQFGLSVNSIYTKDVIDEVFGIGGNIYKSFLEMLDDLVENEVIAGFVPFAYDWRFNVYDIVNEGTAYKNGLYDLITEVTNLASSSYSGKVIIIGHSNGGLLAKALVSELEQLGMDDLVDKVIFIATPHLGTPKAIGTILHGYDQQKLGGIIVDDKTARETIQNMPGAHALLPSEKYLDISAEPLVTFDDGEVTEPYRAQYGTSVENMDEYIDFLNGSDGRVNDFDNISQPYTTNSILLNQAMLDHKSKLDDWTAPPGVEVHNIVGVGLQTISSLEYREVTERIMCSSNIFGQITCDEPEKFLRPYANFSQYGDETVTSLSAEAVVGEGYYFDIPNYTDSLVNPFVRYQHADITEIENIRDLVTNIINSTTTPIEFVTSELPEYDTEYRILSIDSPVRVVVKDNEGNKTGVIINNEGKKEIIEEIPGSQYLEFAGTKYLITPKEIDSVTTLYGEAYGSYTLTLATLGSDDEQVIDSEMINATTTLDMMATFSSSGGEYSRVKVDLDGDGVVDFETTLGGEVVVDTSEVTFEMLRNQINGLDLKRQKTKVLLLLLEISERAYEKVDKHELFRNLADRGLVNLSKMVEKYYQRNWITAEEEANLQTSIEALRAKIK